MLIPVDHGNRNIKTENFIFTSGLAISKMKPSMGNHLLYEGNYYSLSSTRTEYKKDKSVDNTFFILTLFAIADEMLKENNGFSKNIILPVGLPPKFFGLYYKKFENYFLNRGKLEFEYKKQVFNIEIVLVPVYPQAFAALFTKPEIINEHDKLVAIDIGGMTCDIVVYEDGQVRYDLSKSIESGIIKEYHHINSIINSEFGIDLCENDIDKIFKNTSELKNADLTNRVDSLFKTYTKELVGKISESIPLVTYKTALIGGTSRLLEKYLAMYVPNEPYFIGDIHANAKGYRILFELEDSLGKY